MNKNNRKAIAVILAAALLMTMGVVAIPIASVQQTETVAENTSTENNKENTQAEVETDVSEKTTNVEYIKDTSGYEVYEKNVVIETDKGKIIAELYPEIAPKTVENFISLVEDEFYNDLIFHRVIDGFMIQGGDPTGTGTGGSDNNIIGEFTSNGWDKNNLSHTEGVLSMARANEPDTASSQFFICTADDVFLDGEYAAFGKVIEGLDVAKEIAKVETDDNDKPKEDIHMLKVYFENKEKSDEE